MAKHAHTYTKGTNPSKSKGADGKGDSFKTPVGGSVEADRQSSNRRGSR